MLKPPCTATETSLKIEILLVASYDIINNNGVDQTARMRRLVGAFVVRTPRRQGLSRRCPNGVRDINLKRLSLQL